MTSKISFTIRRPASYPAVAPTVSVSQKRSYRQHDVDSSDEDEEEGATELVTGFDQSGAQRLREKPKPSGPLVIPPLVNRDWRAVARARKQQSFIPDGAAAHTGKDGSQGGLGTRDSINSSPQTAGLVMRNGVHAASVGGLVNDAVATENDEVLLADVGRAEESEDDRARRALLAGAAGDDGENGDLTIDAIPVGGNEFARPLDETDAYKQDVVTRPDSATLSDYERVPVSQFGAALLRGMGWKEGTAASRTRRGLVEPWLPAARPALLGIGAKERPAEDIPDAVIGGKGSKRPERRYVPVVKLDRESSNRPPPSRSRSRSPGRSRTASRVPSSASASPYPDDKDGRHRHRERGSTYDDYGHDKSRRERDHAKRDRQGDKDRGTRKDRDDESRGGDRGREREREEPSGRAREFRRDERGRQSKEDGPRY